MNRMLRAAATAAVLALSVFLFFCAAASSASASFVRNNCAPNHAPDDHHRRKDAQAYAVVAEKEGYEWGGGCWNNNNRDDTPGAPDSNGEGPDCSGLVFKSWELRSAAGDTGYTFYNKLENVHGPYASADFHYPVSSDPFVKLADKSRSTTAYMDAFAKNGHVGLLSSRTSPSANTDYIIEAKGDEAGTGEWLESYRYDSAYVAVRRKNWTPDCYPNCQMDAAPHWVVVP